MFRRTSFVSTFLSWGLHVPESSSFRSVPFVRPASRRVSDQAQGRSRQLTNMLLLRETQGRRRRGAAAVVAWVWSPAVWRLVRRGIRCRIPVGVGAPTRDPASELVSLGMRCGLHAFVFSLFARDAMTIATLAKKSSSSFCCSSSAEEVV